jgi:hypothetical protein
VLGWIFTLGTPSPNPSKGRIRGTCSGAETGAENEREGRVGVRGLEGNGTVASASARPWEVASALE